MKYSLLVMLFTLGGYSLYSEAQPLISQSAIERKEATKPIKHVDSAEARSNFLAKTGGFIPTPNKGTALLLLNAQTHVQAESINAVGDRIQQYFRLSVSHRSVPSVAPVNIALEALNNTNTASVVVIGDADGYPALLIAPENRWAMVNVAALREKNDSAETLTDRTCKEVWRAFGYLMGAANSNNEKCLMKTVLNTTDLDALSSKTLSPEPLNKIMFHAIRLGMQPLQSTTYRKAVEEGWAPHPTNAIQLAIWNELKK